MFFLEMVIFILKWVNLQKMVRNQTKICPGKKFVTNEYPGIYIYIIIYTCIYSSRQKASVFYPWGVCYTVELDEMSVWKMLQVSQFDPQNLSMVGPLELGILPTLSAVI